MAKFIINPLSPYICFALALVFFRKDGISLSVSFGDG